MSNTPTVEELIEKFIAFAAFRDCALAAHGEGLSPEFERRLSEVVELAIPGVVIAIIQQYEKKIAKLEVETLRMAIFKQAVKESMAEAKE